GGTARALCRGADGGGAAACKTGGGRLRAERGGGKGGPASASSSKQNQAATQAACSEKKALENQGPRRQQTENCNRTATEIVLSSSLIRLLAGSRFISSPSQLPSRQLRRPHRSCGRKRQA